MLLVQSQYIVLSYKSISQNIPIAFGFVLPAVTGKMTEF